MSFLAPIWLAAAAAVGVGLVIAHLFSTSVPPRDYLPTVRFVPEGAPMAVMRTRRLSDIALLLLRLLAVTLLGFALAGAHVKRGGPPRIVLVDASRAVQSFAEVRDSVRSAERGDALLIAFDSTARRVSRDSLEKMSTAAARGSLSAAIVAAHRALINVTAGRERIELVIVSPLVREQVDSATESLLKLWPGPVRHVRVATAEAPPRPVVNVRATGDDPVAASQPTADGRQPSNARIVRTAPTRSDTLWAHDSGGVLVVWPAEVERSLFVRRAITDTQHAVAAASNVVVASMARTHEPRPGRSVVRWTDGEVAASEIALGQGCIREVAFAVDPVGDVALRESFRGVLATLTEPCGGARDLRHSALGSGLWALDAQRNAIGSQSREPKAQSRFPLWLAALALTVLIVEQFLRARVRTVP